MASNRLRTCLLQQLTSEQFAQIKSHCVDAWRSDDERNAKLQTLDLEFRYVGVRKAACRIKG